MRWAAAMSYCIIEPPRMVRSAVLNFAVKMAFSLRLVMFECYVGLLMLKTMC